jgi:hypothetical protein
MTAETTGWPYDAYQDDPLAALRIPVIGTPHPQWRYEVALVCPSTPAGQDLYPALRPDDAETRMIAAELEWRMTYYNEGWKAKMRRRPLDTDGTTNTVILWKRGDGDWCYRRDSWNRGPLVVPSKYDGEEPAGLEALLDRINDYSGEPNPKWRAFKAAHPEAFPAQEAAP